MCCSDDYNQISAPNDKNKKSLLGLWDSENIKQNIMFFRIIISGLDCIFLLVAGFAASGSVCWGLIDLLNLIETKKPNSVLPSVSLLSI